jgi:hypothetical protein
MKKKTYLLLAFVVLLFTYTYFYGLKPTLAQISIPPTKTNLTNATSMNATLKTIGNLTNSITNTTTTNTNATVTMNK